MELQSAIETRRSIRGYDAGKKVTEEQITALIEAARQAPSWRNTQTARFSVAFSDEMKEKVLREGLPESNAEKAKGAAALIVTSYVKNCSGFSPDGVTPSDAIGNGWGMYDLGLACENFLLKAKEMGMDTLIMGFRYADPLRNLFAIDEKEEIGPVIALGYAAEEPRPKERKSPEEISRFF